MEGNSVNPSPTTTPPRAIHEIIKNYQYINNSICTSCINLYTIRWYQGVLFSYFYDGGYYSHRNIIQQFFLSSYVSFLHPLFYSILSSFSQFSSIQTLPHPSTIPITLSPSHSYSTTDHRKSSFRPDLINSQQPFSSGATASPSTQSPPHRKLDIKMPILLYTLQTIWWYMYH